MHTLVGKSLAVFSDENLFITKKNVLFSESCIKLKSRSHGDDYNKKWIKPQEFQNHFSVLYCICKLQWNCTWFLNKCTTF